MVKHEITFGLEFAANGTRLSDIASSKLAVLAKASVLYGGATWIEGTGAYTPQGTTQVVVEKCATLVIVTNEPVAAFAEWVRNVYSQESVLHTLTGVDSRLVKGA